MKIFKFIRGNFFPKKNAVFIKEIGLGDYGRADWMVVEIDGSKITDYAHLELQSDATTGTRNLVLCVRDFFNGIDISNKSYNFGLNSKASIKGSSLQMIDKGYLFSKLNKKSFWVIQDDLFDKLCHVYNIKMKIIDGKIPENHHLVFVVVKLVYNKKHNIYSIEIDNCYSTTPQELQNSISQKEMLREEVILNSIKNKLDEGNYIAI